jgi:hypothetical protein
MILGGGRHARTRRDSQALIAHLLKDENNPRTLILGGTLAADLPEAMRDMERLRDASKADAAALHIHISPAREMSDAELRRAAEIVIAHLGAQGHPAALVVHEKERRDGAGHHHAHLVLGRVSPDGRVLESGFEKIRLETAARLIEYEMHEPATLGRHHKSSVRWLRANGRDEVARWLEAAHGPDPDRPQSAASPEKRQALSRQRIELSEARAEVRAAWSAGGAAAVREAGYSIDAGRKPGVYIVTRAGAEIGSLDRLTGLKRGDIRAAMDAAPAPAPAAAALAAPALRLVTSRRIPEISKGQKKSGAELVSEAAAEQAMKFAEGFRDRLDNRLAVAAARNFLDRCEPDLQARIAALAKPETLADPATLVATRKRLAAAARLLAAWEARHEKHISALREITSGGRPSGLFSLLTGRISRHDAAVRALSGLRAEREPLRKPVAKMRREVKILEMTQETRQAAHDAARRAELARLEKELALLRDARAALAADPDIARGGLKALAAAARRRQQAREIEQRLREQQEEARRAARSPALRR